MISSVTVKIPLGIHAGIASKLYSISQKYDNHSYIKYKNKTASMNNMLHILALGVKEHENVIIIVDGINEESHMDEIIYVLEHDE